MKFISIIVLILSTLFMAACAKLGLGGHDRDYIRKSQQVSPVVVPHGVPNIKKDIYYPVPNAKYHASTPAVSVVPPTLAK